MHSPDDNRADPLAHRFRSFITDRSFPCVGAKAALKREGMRFIVARDFRSAWDDLRILPALLDLATSYRAEPELFQSLVVLFEQVHGWFPDGSVRKHYYARESVGIACGLFIAAIHRMGLVTLTHTPSPMRFLTEILGRPRNERPFVLLPVGHPADDCVVPDLQRKALPDVAVFIEP